MNDQMWERVKEIFHHALKRTLPERREFLDDACGEDDALRSEVGALLASHDEVGDDSRLSSSEGRAGRVFPVEGPGSVIGRYKPLEEIGEGGMGVVYLADQEEPVRRKVALKIIKLGMDTKEVIARFEAERQALAIMDHTNIAKVFDAGTTELGRPYFVMEHIPGIPITDYCDQQRLNAQERLKLFIPVCHAIHHAHQKGIIHRDVKPTNVLVMTQDGKPVPKVIDFGVAKATNQRLTEKTIFTEQGVMIGTPVYMSPEQADMTGLTVDTTTDVYSLGALLYELLASAPPFDPKSLREVGFEAIQRIIREVAPPKPSNRFNDLGDEGTTVAERRRTEPATLERQIRGELDWITMRAMEKDRSRRYPSASEFAADIERHLQDEPVEAGPPGRIYRIRKFVQRNKAGVGLVAAALAISFAFTVTMTVQADRITRERDRAQFEARRSRVEAQFWQSVLDESKYLDGQVRLDKLMLLARELWELQKQSLTGDAAGLALCAVNILPILDLAVAFGGGEDLSEPRRLREEIEPVAFSLIDQAVAERDTSIIKTLDLMIFRMKDREKNGDAEFQVIADLYRDVIALCGETLPPGDPYLKSHTEGFARYLEKTGRRALDEERVSDAEPVLREALQLQSRAQPRGDPYAVTQGLLGECLTKLGQYSEAEPLLLKSLEEFDSRDVLLSVIELYESWGRPDQAEHYRQDLLVDSAREVGTIWAPEVGDRHRCNSGEFEGRSVWVFRGNRDSRWAWTDDLDAGDGIRLFDHPHAVGNQCELLRLNADERAYNDAHRTIDHAQWYLVSGGVIADPDRDRALVLYGKFLDAPETNRRVAGFSLAVLEHPDSTAVRPTVSPESEEPTLLFQGGDLHLDAGALMDGGYLYLYSATYVSSAVARAPMADALDRDAWRFYTRDGTWSKDPRDAAGVMSGQKPIVSVHWNEYLQKYLAVHGNPRRSGIHIRTADRPEGPWSSPRQIFAGLPTKEWPNHGLVAHPEFSRDGGRIEYMTYNHPTGPFQREVRLVEVTFR